MDTMKKRVCRVRVVREDRHYVGFLRELQRHGLTITKLAEQARVGRCSLQMILPGQRCGKHTWKHVLPHIPASALFHLKLCAAWNNVPESEVGR